MSGITLEYIEQEIAEMEKQREEYWILHQKADGSLQTLYHLRAMLLASEPPVLGENGAITGEALSRVLGGDVGKITMCMPSDDEDGDGG